jgi:hypothetical protein
MGALAGKVSIPKDVIFTEVSGEAVLLNMATGKYYSLDEVGARIWNLITQYRQLEEVYRALLDEYDVAPQRLEEDLLALTDKLVANALLQIVDP